MFTTENGLATNFGTSTNNKNTLGNMLYELLELMVHQFIVNINNLYLTLLPKVIKDVFYVQGW